MRARKNLAVARIIFMMLVFVGPRRFYPKAAALPPFIYTCSIDVRNSRISARYHDAPSALVVAATPLPRPGRTVQPQTHDPGFRGSIEYCLRNRRGLASWTRWFFTTAVPEIRTAACNLFAFAPTRHAVVSDGGSPCGYSRNCFEKNGSRDELEKIAPDYRDRTFCLPEHHLAHIPPRAIGLQKKKKKYPPPFHNAAVLGTGWCRRMGNDLARHRIRK